MLGKAGLTAAVDQLAMARPVRLGVCFLPRSPLPPTPLPRVPPHRVNWRADRCTGVRDDKLPSEVQGTCPGEPIGGEFLGSGVCLPYQGLNRYFLKPFFHHQTKQCQGEVRYYPTDE